MISFHHRFLNTQFKDEKNIQKMEKRLIVWAEELVSGKDVKTTFPDTKHFHNNNFVFYLWST